MTVASRKQKMARTRKRVDEEEEEGAELVTRQFEALEHSTHSFIASWHLLQTVTSR
jgi:hypothetical protein